MFAIVSDRVCLCLCVSLCARDCACVHGLVILCALVFICDLRVHLLVLVSVIVCVHYSFFVYVHVCFFACMIVFLRVCI